MSRIFHTLKKSQKTEILAYLLILLIFNRPQSGLKFELILEPEIGFFFIAFSVKKVLLGYTDFDYLVILSQAKELRISHFYIWGYLEIKFGTLFRKPNVASLGFKVAT